MSPTAPSPPPLVRAEQLLVGYAGSAILPPIDVTLHAGELWAVMGHNGGGKTTFLRTLLGLLPEVGGAIDHSPGVRLGYVPQRSEIDLAVPARVVDVVRGGADRGWSFVSPRLLREREPDVGAAMSQTHIAELAHVRFAELSEGQKQRVLLARALVCRPSLLVLDEPTSAMDLGAERAIFSLLDELRSTRRFGLVLVTHRLGLLSGRASHALLLDRDQRIALAGSFDAVSGSAAFIERFGFIVERRPLDGVLRQSSTDGEAD